MISHNQLIVENFKKKKYNDKIIESLLEGIISPTDIEYLKNNNLNETNLRKYINKIKDFPKKKIKNKIDKEKVKLKKLEKSAKSVLTKNGLNPNKVEQVFNNEIKNNYRMYMKGTEDEKNLEKNLEKIKKDKLKEKDDLFKDTIKKLFTFDKNTPVNLLIAFAIVFVIGILNTLAIQIFGAIAGIWLSTQAAQMVGLALGAILIAPLTEEFSKLITIKDNMGSEFLLVFNIMEFAGYYFSLVAMGMPVVVVLINRALPVIMHYTTAFLIQMGVTEDKINESNINTRSKFLLAIFIHALWNFFAALGMITKTLG